MMSSHLRLGLLVLVLLVPGTAQSDDGPNQHQHAAGEAEKLGKVDFAVSCSARARETFGRAVALLHSFWYDEAEKAFGEVTRIDPSCVMGHWGVAMSLYHPIWAPPSPVEFERGRAAAEKAKSLRAKTEREKDYVTAIAAFYEGEGREHSARKLAFEKGMEQVVLGNPKDREAAVFYGLALLGTAPPADKTYANQKKAAEILNRILPEAPNHPGVAHYLIHSFDYPQLASLALPAAKAYSKIAASSPHALHMPSHIFTRLALWEDSIQSNMSSATTAKRHAEKTRPGASSFDQLHALDYLAYAYLQQGRDDKAKAILDELSTAGPLDADNFAAAYALAAVPARYALERREWKEAAGLTVGRVGFPWSKFAYAEALTHFARGVGGARAGDLAAARSGLARLDEIHSVLVTAKDAYWAGQVEIQRLATSAWLAQAEGRKQEALLLMRAAADLEDATDKHPVTPGPVLPSRELLGDLLVEQGETGKALAEYEASLQTSPGRLNSLSRALRAAADVGQGDKAQTLFTKLEALCRESEGPRAGLDSLRTLLARKP